MNALAIYILCTITRTTVDFKLDVLVQKLKLSYRANQMYKSPAEGGNGSLIVLIKFGSKKSSFLIDLPAD